MEIFEYIIFNYTVCILLTSKCINIFIYLFKFNLREKMISKLYIKKKNNIPKTMGKCFNFDIKYKSKNKIHKIFDDYFILFYFL